MNLPSAIVRSLMRWNFARLPLSLEWQTVGRSAIFDFGSAYALSARANSLDDLLRKLNASKQRLRLDEYVTPTM